MKYILSLIIFLLAAEISIAQLHSGTKATPLPAQPVPASAVTEKSAPTPKPLNAPAANPVPPIYPGGDVKLIETQRETVFPATTSSPTQPAQREPLTPIDSKNVLKPTRPQREEGSRRATGSMPVQRSVRPTGIEQAKLSGVSAAIENPHTRKPLASRTAPAYARRSPIRVAERRQPKKYQLLSSDKSSTKKTLNAQKNIKKRKANTS